MMWNSSMTISTAGQAILPQAIDSGCCCFFLFTLITNIYFLPLIPSLTEMRKDTGVLSTGPSTDLEMWINYFGTVVVSKQYAYSLMNHSHIDSCSSLQLTYELVSDFKSLPSTCFISYISCFTNEPVDCLMWYGFCSSVKRLQKACISPSFI